MRIHDSFTMIYAKSNEEYSGIYYRNLHDFCVSKLLICIMQTLDIILITNLRIFGGQIIKNKSLVKFSPNSTLINFHMN